MIAVVPRYLPCVATPRCTPIDSVRRENPGPSGTQTPVVPFKPKRSSSDTGKTLRRQLVSSQLKVISDLKGLCNASIMGLPFLPVQLLCYISNGD